MLQGNGGAPRNPVGRSLWVRYRGSPEFHQRLVLAASSDGDRCYVVTPDFDDYLEDFSRGNADLDAVHWSMEDGAPPPQVPRNHAYRFRAWPDPDLMAGMQQRAERALPRERRGVFGAVAGLFGGFGGGAQAPPPGPVRGGAVRHVGGLFGGGGAAADALGAGVAGAPPGLGPPMAPGGEAGGPMFQPGAPVAGQSLGGTQRGAFLPPAVSPELDPYEKWIAAATVWAGDEKVKRGTPMRLGAATLRQGRYALQEYKETVIPCYNLRGDSLDEFIAAEGEYDARVLPVRRGPSGVRSRTWREVVEEVSETPFEDFPMEGPRTVRWCVEFIGRRQGGPLDHHMWWVSCFNLSIKDPAVKQHELAMKVLELMGTYDQLDLGNCAGLERLLREAQLTEWHFEEKRRAAEGSRAGGTGSTPDEAGGEQGGKKGNNKKKGIGAAGPSSEEVAMWTGATKDNQNVMVCPALLRYVSKEAETQVNLLKSVRKAREERALAGRDA